MIKSPEEFQASYLCQERGRIDVIALGSDYCPNKKQALQFKNVYFRATDVEHNALQLIAALLETKKTYLFVNASEDQLHAVWKHLCEVTSLDVRFGTIGYNASGITIYQNSSKRKDK